MNGFSVTGATGKDNGPPAQANGPSRGGTDQKPDQSITALLFTWQKMRNAAGLTL